MITDRIKRRAFDAAAPFFDDSGGDHFDAVLVALEAVAPMLIAPYAKSLLEIAELAMPDTYFQTDSRCVAARAILARAQELDPK